MTGLISALVTELRPSEVKAAGSKSALSAGFLEQRSWVRFAKKVAPGSRTAVLSIITRGGKWVETTIPADPLYQHLLLTAERKFWRSVQSGEPLASSALNRRGQGSKRSGRWT